jgi:hypothetical protein
LSIVPPTAWACAQLLRLRKTRVWQSTARVIYFPRERQSPGGRQGFEAALLWPPDAKGNSIGL